MRNKQTPQIHFYRLNTNELNIKTEDAYI